MSDGPISLSPAGMFQDAFQNSGATPVMPLPAPPAPPPMPGDPKADAIAELAAAIRDLATAIRHATVMQVRIDA